MAYRLIQGISQRDEPIALDLFSDQEADIDFLTHPHTLQWHLLEQKYPHVINREGYQQWVDSGKPSLAERASSQVEKLLKEKGDPVLSSGLKSELREIMEKHAQRYGLETLPAREGS
jgi:trimethylamine--corrinoid protein Co-methyltransferase